MACSICSHEQRREIEELLFLIDTPIPVGAPDTYTPITLSTISERFSVVIYDLQVHALLHTPLCRLEEEQESIAATLKKREATLLDAAANEYFLTMKATGKELRDRLTGSMVTAADFELEGPSIKDPFGFRGKKTSPAQPKPKRQSPISREMVELYIGVGNNLRQTITAIVDMNQKVSGETDPALEALRAIITAVQGKPQVDENATLPCMGSDDE